MVFHSEYLSAGIIGGAQGSVDVLVLQKTCVRCPVRIDQAVQAEIPVVLQLTVIPAVPVHGLPVLRRTLIDRVVTPLPDKPAAERRILLGQIQILLKVPGAVAHRMAVFHQKQRDVRIIVQIVRDLVEAGIHAPVEVNIRDIKLPDRTHIKSTLIMGQSCRVVFFGPTQSFLKGAAVTALVAHGPYQNGRTVPVPDDHGPDPVQRRLDEIRVVRDPEMGFAHPLRVILFPEGEGSRPMALIIGFVDDIEAQLITELIKPG